MRNFLLPLLILLPAVASAAGPDCKYSQPRELQLDLAGVKAVVFDIGANDLKIEGVTNGKPSLKGRACASQQKTLEQLKLTQQKRGDKLYVSARREGASGGIFFGDNYAYLDLSGVVPESITVQLKVGSGDASVTGVSILSADVGSGDLVASNIRGLVAAEVGSGDITLSDIGSLNVIAVSSGDLSVKAVHGPAKIGRIGSGDLTLDGAIGDVSVVSLSSGDAILRDVSGSVDIGSIESGDAEISRVRGNLTVRKVGSGSVTHNGVDGHVNVPSRD